MKASAVKDESRLRVTDQVPRAVALAFLRCDPRENVFLISRIMRSGSENTNTFRSKRSWTALLY